MSYRELTVWDFLEEIASPKSVPAGGSSAAVSGAMAAALLAKMGRLALRQEGVSLSHDLVVQAEALRRRLMALAYKDGQTFKTAAASSRAEAFSSEEIEAAWQEAVSVPLHIAECCDRILELSEALRLAGLAAADVQAAVVLARACLEVQLLNAMANLTRVKDTAFHEESEEKLTFLGGRLDRSAQRKEPQL